jgi:ABC-type nitrate/sulfonate/bicarbonate transport system permease component
MGTHLHNVIFFLSFEEAQKWKTFFLIMAGVIFFTKLVNMLQHFSHLPPQFNNIQYTSTYEPLGIVTKSG